MREYQPYLHKVNVLIGEATKEIRELFAENDTEEIALDTGMRFLFIPRVAGDEATIAEIIGVALRDGLICLSSKEGTYWLYELADRTDMILVYEMVYLHFNKN